jgi:alkylmercury lyase
LDSTHYFAAIAERFAPAKRHAFAALFVALLHELVKGRPVSQEALASALGWPVERVTAELEQVQGTEYDDDENIVGYGLTLRETAHALDIDGQRLYAWCALDTLIFPAVLGRTAQVVSHCFATGTPIVLAVTPEGIERAEPPDPALSLILPGTASEIRHSFCCHVHFFASASAAERWTTRGAGTEIVSIREACQLGHELARHLLRVASRGT